MQTDQTLSAVSPWRAALYIRLSRDDGDKPESNSVTNQREILKEHLKPERMRYVQMSAKLLLHHHIQQ